MRIEVRPKTAEHGTREAYRQGCHCAQCRTAAAEYHYRLKQTRALALQGDPSLAVHGRVTTYNNWDCRCEQCVSAYSEYNRARRAVDR